ncbi:MAG: tRNA pseudouridine synthase A [Lachnospiraceae bacterium]|nr:tRNA pseudouridine synthase A [Lachnospiraceae bacterium]
MRVLIKVAYDGTDFAGWQKQPGQRTVEGELLKALADLFSREIDLIGGSRTDAGVHSYGNPAVFDIETRMPVERIAPALNVRLPEDVRVLSSSAVAEDFHPHKIKSRKTYEYRIRVARTLLPTDRYYFHTVHVALDLTAMQKAADLLVGKHDFTSFSSVHAQVTSRVRTIYELQVTGEGHDSLEPERYRRVENFGGSEHLQQADPSDQRTDHPELTEMDVRIRVTGDGFLYNMVRIIAGTLIEVGRGAMSPLSIKEILEAKDRSLAGPTAPAKGLFLIGTEFEGEQ